MHDHSSCSHELTGLATQIGIGEQAARAWVDFEHPIVIKARQLARGSVAHCDVYKPERLLDDALFRPEVRQAFRQLVEQGWTDALRELHPGERIYTFWEYFRNAWGRDAGLRIDHLLRQSVDRRTRGVRGGEKASDHAPACVELKHRAPSTPV